MTHARGGHTSTSIGPIVATGALRVIAADERSLSADEARAYIDAPITDAERDSTLALARWFTRRYATPALRLAYVRRAYARWARTRGIATPPLRRR